MVAEALAAPTATAPLAARVRRWLLVAAPVLAGLFAIVGAVADPAVGEEGRALWAGYAENPDPLQWKSFGFHWSYAFWGATAFVLALAVRARGAWLGLVALVLAFVGMTTLPGLLVVDFYDSAIGQVGGVDTTERVNDLMEDTMWGPLALAIPGMIGFLLSLPVAALAAWRGGILPWWTPVASVAIVVVFIGSGVAVWGTVVVAVLFAALALAIARSEQLKEV